MKRTLSMALALIMLVATLSATLVFAASADTDDGTITPDTSWYDESKDTFELSDAADFLGFIRLLNGNYGETPTVTFQGKTIKLTADIDLNPGWNAEEYFNNLTDTDDMTIAIPPVNEIDGYRDPNASGAAKNNLALFYGTFDGQGHVISGVYWNQPTSDMGLFGATFELGSDVGQTSTVIKNVAFVNSYMMLTQHRQAALIGMIRNDTTIENVYNGMFMHSNATAQTSGCSAFAGFVACYDNDTKSSVTMKDCVMDGTFLVQNANPVVGFVLGTDKLGDDYKITLEDCLMSGTIKAPETKVGNVGGFYFKHKSHMTIKNCVMAGTVPSYAYALGWDNRENCTVTAYSFLYTDGIDETLVNPPIGTTPIEIGARKVTLDNLKALSTWATSSLVTGYDDWTATIEEGGIALPISADLASAIKAYNEAAADSGSAGDNAGDNSNDNTNNNTNDNTNNNTNDNANDNTSNNTNDNNETKAPETNKASEATEAADEKGGCGSTVAGGFAIVAVVTGIAAAAVGKKKED